MPWVTEQNWLSPLGGRVISLAKTGVVSASNAATTSVQDRREASGMGSSWNVDRSTRRAPGVRGKGVKLGDSRPGAPAPCDGRSGGADGRGGCPGGGKQGAPARGGRQRKGHVPG